MEMKLSDRLINAMPWLDQAATKMHAAFDPLLGQEAPRAPRDILYGVWLGHPLHPALIALPIGFWTSTTVFDLAGEERAADLSLELGLVTSLGAVASGAAQWQDTMNQDKARRLGTLHALLNSVATVAYAGSWVARRRGARGAGVGLAAAGLGLSSFSAWLGGDLAYDLGIGVDRTAFQQPPADWTDVAAESDLPEGTPKRVEAGAVPVLLVRHGAEIHAIAATCSHLGGPLDQGELDGETVSCPWHNSVFCLTDGTVRHGPATIAQPAFDVRRENGRIAVKPR